MRLNRQRPGVGHLTAAVIVLLTLSMSIAVSGLVWSSNLLQQTSAALVRAAEGVRLARDVQEQLFSHQRLSVLADARSTDVRLAERELLGQINSSLWRARDEARTGLLEELASQVSAYFAQHNRYRQRETNAAATLMALRPAFNRAVDAAQALAENSERELERGNAEAQRLGDLFKLAAAAAAGLGLALVLLIGFATRRMILRPILGTRDALVRFRGGDYEVKADENVPRELGEIAGAFNDMAAELSRRREEQLAFLGGVVHDLRNPLSALKTGVTRLGVDESLSSEARRTLGILSRQLEHLERMCGDLLELSRIEAGRLELNREVFDLRDAVRSVAELYRPAAGSLELTIDLGAEAVNVDADRLRIEQVIGNLVSNAIKYSGDGRRVALGLSCADDTARISVADDGVGIPEDELENIFRPFRHASGNALKGAGLGLSVVRRIVTAHGGTIRVQSTVGLGSTFYVHLPLYEPERADS